MAGGRHRGQLAPPVLAALVAEDVHDDPAQSLLVVLHRLGRGEDLLQLVDVDEGLEGEVTHVGRGDHGLAVLEEPVEGRDRDVEALRDVAEAEPRDAGPLQLLGHRIEDPLRGEDGLLDDVHTRCAERVDHQTAKYHRVFEIFRSGRRFF